MNTRLKTRKGSILIGVLWCMALLSIIVIGLLHNTQMDLRIVKNHSDRIQAHYLALAGVEKAKALLYQDANTRRQDGKNHTGELYDSAQNFRDCALGNGVYRVFRRGGDENASILYGISDEASRLNLNMATAEELMKLRDMKSTVAASILEWRNASGASAPDDDAQPGAGNPPTKASQPSTSPPNDNDPSAGPVSGGAGSDYYLSLEPPRQPRLGPFQTTREALMVQGVTRKLFFGQDYKQNELLDVADQAESEKNKSDSAAAPDQPDSQQAAAPAPATSKGRSSRKSSSKADEKEDENPTDAGWNSLLTVDSAGLNQSASGKDRVNIQTASETDLAAIQGFTPEIARAIVQYREKKKFQSIADLLDVTPSQTEGEFGKTINQPVNTGEPVVSQDLFQQVADDVTVDDKTTSQGLVNVNTASADVLACLPGITPELAQAVTAYRQSSGFFQNTAGLLQVQGFSREIFQQIAPRITARSETFRIVSEGKVLSSGVKQRIQVIVQVTKDDVKTLSYREDL